MQLACSSSQQNVSFQKANTFFVVIINFKILENGMALIRTLIKISISISSAYFIFN